MTTTAIMNDHQKNLIANANNTGDWDSEVPNGTEVSKPTLNPELRGTYIFPLIITIFACAFGSSFQFGYQFAYLNTPDDIIKAWLNQSFTNVHRTWKYEDHKAQLWAVTVASLALGAFIVCLVAGTLADKIGRKTTLMWNNVIVVIFCLLISAAFFFENYMLLIFARFVVGFNAGINMALSAFYLNEIAPINLRGAIGCMEQLFGLFGILFASIIGMPFALGRGDPDSITWKLIFYIPLIPMVVQLVLMGMFSPESPKYTYVIRRDVEKAKQDLQRLRAKENVNAELQFLEDEVIIADKHKSLGLRMMIKLPEMRWLIVLTLYMVFSVQCSGFAAIENYSTHIFRAALEGSEMDEHHINYLAKWLTCGLVSLTAIMVIICIFLVERSWMRRRVLYLVSTAGSGLFTAIAGFSGLILGPAGSTITITALMLYIILYSIGMGSISAVYLYEFYPTEARGIGCTTGMVLHQVFRGLVQLSFPLLFPESTKTNSTAPANATTIDKNKSPSHFAFFIFAACMLCSTLFGMMVLPETRGRTQQQISRHIEQRRHRFCQIACFCCPGERYVLDDNENDNDNNEGKGDKKEEVEEDKNERIKGGRMGGSE